MPEHLHHDAGRRTLDEEHGGKGVPQVVETNARQASTLQQAMERPGYVTRFDGCPNSGREDEAGLVPSTASQEAILQLARPVQSQGSNSHGWHRNNSPASVCFHLDELGLAPETIQSVPDVKLGTFQVDV
jgi:hypothetical protein